LHYAGDTSSDMDWYGIRAKVISIFVASELFMLTDKSTDYKETMDFVDRRVAQLKHFDDHKNDWAALATSLYLGKNSLIEMLKDPVVSDEFMAMRSEVRGEKGDDGKYYFFNSKIAPDSEAQAEDTQKAEFDSKQNRNSENRESSKVDGVDWSGLQMLGMQFSETVGKH
jgi:hypothetical protein